jgi:general L-amino acid transport system permease protein
MKDNLFRTWWDTLITILAGGLLIWLLGSLVIWVFTSAQWEIVRVNLTSFMVGRFPRDQLWRVAVALLVGAFAGGVLLGMTKRLEQKVVPLEALRTFLVRAWPFVLLVLLLLILAESLSSVLLVLGAIVSFLVGRGAGYRLPKRLNWIGITGAVLSPIAVVAIIVGFGGVGWDLWGGLLLTLFLAIGSILLSFPFGVLLALGRRSKLPAARWLSVAYIEIVRGVPLIALLFMGFIMLALFLPPGTSTPSLVVRGIIVLTAFTAAYVAEIVRGGLQSVHSGQEEAAQAVGMSPLQTTFYIVLPQALTAVIPALVGQFISLFKDTSLVAIVGLLELLAVAQVVTQQGEFRGEGLLTETLLFAAMIYWVGSFTMSRESQRLEKRLGVGER